jgi:pimeloyl-ACP methyl ester carboxylesterase
VDLPETQYARSGDVSIAYQVLGEGPLDLIFVPPHVSNVELVWEIPPRAAGMRRLAEFSRVITFDKRGTGLSDRMSGVPSLEERMDDVRAVMDAAGSSRAALLGVLEGGPMSIVFAATYPDRCLGLALYATFARAAWAPDQ